MSKSTRGKKYSPEFKAQAVEMAKEIGASQTSQNLGVAYQTIQRWVKLGEVGSGTSCDEPSYTDLAKENKRLKKELEYSKKLNDILKKSTAIFSKDIMEDIE